MFDTPKTLPPLCTHDHCIPLEPGSRPVSVRLYRYPHIQKNEIERAVKEKLATGIIRLSFSPFSLSVLLVKKRMVLGTFVWTIKRSIPSLSRTDTQSQPSMSCLTNSMVRHSSLSWILSLDIIKFECNPTTSIRPPFAPMMATTNFWSCHLDSPMLR